MGRAYHLRPLLHSASIHIRTSCNHCEPQ
jgi:hypothetical protein